MPSTGSPSHCAAELTHDKSNVHLTVVQSPR